MSTPEIEKPNVVVVGGGAAGILIVRHLAAKLDLAKYNLVLVTATPYYTHHPACIRMLVSSAGSLEDAAQIPYDTLLTRGGKQLKCRVVVGRVVRISEELPNGRGNGSGSGGGGRVDLEGGESVGFSVVVLATGCGWEGPLAFPGGTREEVGAWVKEWRERFEKAEDIVIVGGGATGLEFAGELRDLSQTKRITVVHDEPLLLSNAYPDSFRQTVAKDVRRRDIAVIVDDSISSLEISEASTIRTEKGRLLVADLVIPCRGPHPNTDYLAMLGDESIAATGHVKVIPTFQLSGHPRIFAAGDIVDWDEQKQAEKYGAHAGVVVKNVLDVLRGRQPDALYRGCYESITIANGKSGGNTYYSFWGPELQFGDLVSTAKKSKSLKVHSTRRQLGLIV
ncbi:hypothetical protein D9611_014486 [Ephemerocybe angulata]|uniref:FAD/NAD(P)-binding domain-containing protein n=1 Tax=Ephemerocybe angulata TaxID=980116 RepID=A0A8H5C4N5_9AGAR|nr:hypothetical protein D9611_014486 [Tulosesus angulatus]